MCLGLVPPDCNYIFLFDWGVVLWSRKVLSHGDWADTWGWINDSEPCSVPVRNPAIQVSLETGNTTDRNRHVDFGKLNQCHSIPPLFPCGPLAVSSSSSRGMQCVAFHFSKSDLFSELYNKKLPFLPWSNSLSFSSNESSVRVISENSSTIVKFFFFHY